MLFNRLQYCLLVLTTLFVAGKSVAQIGGIGGALMNITFGAAATDDLTIAGPRLPMGTSTFNYTGNTCPSPDSYAVVSGVNPACNTGNLISLFADNTPFPDANGYMMMLSDVSHSTPKVVFEHRLTACYDVDYQFSAAMINLDKPTSTNCHRFSSFTLEVRDGSGILLNSTTTGDMQFAVYNMGYHFTKYVVDFRLSASHTLPITVRIIDEPKAISVCNNFIGIDDINVVVTGSKANIVFDATPVGYWVKSSCFQDNQQFTMLATVETDLVNPAVQWEQSTNDGLTWSDIPGATGYTLVQNFPVPDTFLFRLRAADRLLIGQPGCAITSDVLKVQVNGLPVNYSATVNTPVCAGNEIKFDAAGGTSYEWRGPNGFYDNVKFPTIFRSALKDSGWYFVNIISLGGCQVTDSVFVNVVGNDINAGPDTTICAGSSVQLSTGNSATYKWSPAEGLSSTNIRNPVATPLKTTAYTIVIQDQNGCSGNAEAIITVKNAVEVKAVISSSKYVCRQSDSIRFASNSTGIIDRWQWSFGNGITSDEKSPPVQYYQNIAAAITGYRVKLTVTDTAGCVDETVQLLKVEDLCNLSFPTAFSPNGDGLNDYFWPLNAFKAEQVHFVVFNRNGYKIFETTSWPAKWDGTFRGQPQDPGTYAWIFEYTDTSGKMQVQKGTVILIR